MISSTSNSRVRLLRALTDRRDRLREGLFLVEGVRLVEDVVDAGVRPALVLYDEALGETERGRALLADLEPLSDWMEVASPHVIDSVSAVQHSQGIVLAAPLPRPGVAVPGRPASRRTSARPGALHDLALVLDDVADPGNAGAILRTARSAGVRRVMASGGVDLFGPKVVRAAGGAHFWLQIDAGFRWDADETAFAAGTPVVLAEAHAGQPYWEFDWSRPLGLVVGGEARGATLAAKRAVTHRVRVPMPGGGDSLNVAMATGVLLFEAVRQRTLRPATP
jgi:RNA methyltransferase, TrmH family